MYITIINDCKSENDIGRQKTRYSWIFPGVNINFVGIDSSLGFNSTLEAAGNLIDILDASDGQEGVVALNVAPRGQVQEDGENGSKFSYFWYKKTLVVATIKGYNLSLVKKLKLTNTINVLETNDVLEFAYDQQLTTYNQKEYIKNTQFRSFDFQPRVARWLTDKIKLPHTPVSIDKFADVPNAVWLVDSFGNIKTTILNSDLSITDGRPERAKRVEGPSLKINTNLGTFPYYERLKLVPDGETAIYTGSSGIGDNRFLELATQAVPGSAVKKLKLKVGDKIEVL